MPPSSDIKAIVIEKIGSAAIKTVPLPKLRDDYILIRTIAVGLNPTDWKHVQGWGDPTGARVGCDFAGIVEEVGPKVTKPFVKGDRIAGVVHGSNESQHEDGAFAEYLVAKGDLAIKTPDSLSDEEAATLGISITTVGQGLYQALKLPLPDSPSATPFPLLIYGGSTATGILGIQFAKLSGAKVAVTCSPHNFDLVKSLGADAAFDYSSPTLVDDIKAWDSNIQLAWDCISTPDAAKATVAAMSEAGGDYRSLLPSEDKLIKSINPKVTSGFTLMYTVFGEAFQKGAFKSSPSSEDFELGKRFWELSRQLLANGKIKTAPLNVNRGGPGLQGVLVGLEELRQNKVSGGKLVYTL